MKERKKGKKLERRENTRALQGNVYIFCEGEKTEKKYFTSFRSQICKGRCRRRKLPEIKIIPSKNCGAPANIEFINSYARNNAVSERDGDFVVCVIDCDANRDEDINKAIKMAEGKKDGSELKVNICLSNPSFEIWYLLHYELYKKPLDQKNLESRLKQYIKDYRKEGDYYNCLENKMEKAMGHAEDLNKYHHEKGVELLSTRSNPSTMVPYFITHIKNFMEYS